MLQRPQLLLFLVLLAHVALYAHLYGLIHFSKSNSKIFVFNESPSFILNNKQTYLTQSINIRKGSHKNQTQNLLEVKKRLENSTIKKEAEKYNFEATNKPEILCQNDGEVKREELSEDAVLNRTKNCSSFQTTLADFEILKEEEEYPLAYILMAHHEIGIMELFLSTLFRPTDAFCIHIDQKESLISRLNNIHPFLTLYFSLKASDKVWSAAKSLAACYRSKFPNSTIIFPEERVSVFRGHISVLFAYNSCLKALLRTKHPWKSVLNPAATSLPATTIHNIRKRVSKNNGTIVENYRLEQKWRILYKYILQRNIRRYWSGIEEGYIRHRHRRYSPRSDFTPYNLDIRTGYFNVAISRKLAKFAFSSEMGRKLLNWLKYTRIPDGLFLPTLASIIDPYKEKVKQRKAHEPPEPLSGHSRSFRYSLWLGADARLNKTPKAEIAKVCSTLAVKHGMCIFGVNDLSKARGSGSLFINKFSLSVSPTAAVCQARWIKNQTITSLQNINNEV